MKKKARARARGTRGKGRARKGDASGGALAPILASAALLVVGSVGWLKLAPTPRPHLPSPATPVVTVDLVDGGAPPVYLGFDTSEYPGDAVMRKLKRSSPYQFVGYYLRSPNHAGDSWMGTWRAALRAQGWHVAVLYVGQQSHSLTETQAKHDAAEAEQEAEGEGFPRGAVVYLDVEAVDEPSAALGRYVRAFIGRLAHGGRYKPGIYCHAKNAAALQAMVGGAVGSIPFWVAGGDGFGLDAHPARSGVEHAIAWQGLLDSSDPSGASKLVMDVSTATTPQPSGF